MVKKIFTKTILASTLFFGGVLGAIAISGVDPLNNNSIANKNINVKRSDESSFEQLSYTMTFSEIDANKNDYYKYVLSPETFENQISVYFSNTKSFSNQLTIGQRGVEKFIPVEGIEIDKITITANSGTLGGNASSITNGDIQKGSASNVIVIIPRDKSKEVKITNGPAMAQFYVTSIVIDYHVASYSQNSDADNHWQECVCGTKKDVTAHTWDNKEVLTSPSHEHAGETKYTCVCGETKSEITNPSIEDELTNIKLVNSLTYNGNEQTQEVEVTYDGVKLVENTHYTVTNNVQTNAGTYELTITGKDLFEGTKTIEYKVAKAPLIVTVDNKEIIYGDDVPTYTASYSGFVNGETEENLIGSLVLSCDYEKNSDIGNYLITASGLSSENYEITYVNGNLKVKSDKEEVTYIDALVKSEFMESYLKRENTGISPLKVTNFDKYASLGGPVYVKDSNGTLVEFNGSKFEYGVQYVAAMILCTNFDLESEGLLLGGYTFADSLELPEGFTYRSAQAPSDMIADLGEQLEAIEVLYELPILEREEVTYIDALVKSEFMESYLKRENTGISPLKVTNFDKYASLGGPVYVKDSNGTLVEFNGSKFEYGVQYVAAMILCTNFDLESEGLLLGGYTFADSLELPEGFTYRSAQAPSDMIADLGEQLEAIEVLYELPILEREEVTSINVKVNDEFLEGYLEGQFNDVNWEYFISLNSEYTYFNFDYCFYVKDSEGDLTYYDPYDSNVFENGVQYVVSMIYVNGTDFDGLGLGDYQFADPENINVPEGFTVEKYVLHPNNVAQFGEDVRAIEVFYELPILNIEKEPIEFDYYEDLEPTIEELQIGEKIPNYVSFGENGVTSGILMPSESISSKVRIELGISVYETTNSFVFDGHYLVPETTSTVDGHAYVVVFVNSIPESGLIINRNMELIGIPEDYSYEILIDQEYPELSHIIIYKYLGVIEEKEVIEFTYDPDYEPTIEELALGNQVPEYVNFEEWKGFILPAENSASKLDGNISIALYDSENPKNILSGKILQPGATIEETGYAFAVAEFRPWGNTVFSEDMIIAGIPEDYTIDIVVNSENLENSYIVIYKYLGEINYDFINQVDVNVSQDFINSYLALENISEELSNAVVINEQNAKYVTGIVDLKYLNPSTNELEFVNLEEPLSVNYTYYFVVCLITGDESNVEEFNNYRFASDVKNKTEGWIVNPVWGDDKGNLTVIELAIKLPTLKLEDITQAEISLGEQLTYNGQAQTQEIVVKYNDDTLVKGTDYTITGNVNTNAGTYELTVTGIGSYEGSVKVEYVIAKATYDMSGVKLENKTVTYNGSEHVVVITGTLPSGVTVSYENNEQTNSGTYKVVAKFEGNENYNAIPDMEATLTINKATYDMSGVKLENKTVTYNGSEHVVVITGTLPSGVTVSYENNEQTNSGTYKVVAKFEGNENYNAIPDMEATLTINKATYDMSGVKLENKTVTYNGSEQVVVITGTLPSGVTVSYENNKQTNVGTYKVVAKFEGNENYNAIPDMEATLTINKAKASITVDTDDINVIYGDTITLPEGTTNFGEVVVTKVEMVNVGEYKVTYSVISTNNYDGDTKEVKVIISPLAVSEPTLKGTYTYNGSEQTVELNNLESFMTIVSGNKQTNAGNYEVVITLDANHVWKEGLDGKIAWSIAKATYDLSDISFNNKTVVENGENQSLTITGTLPNGVTVTYSLTECVEPGVYEITASFTGDYNNYNVIDDMNATLVIEQTVLEPETNLGEGHENDVVVTSPEGIDPNKQLVVELVEVVDEEKDYSQYLKKNQKVAIAYDIKLLDENGIEVQPDGTLIIKILIPESLRGREFDIMHIHEGKDKTMMEYTIEGDYVVIHVDELSEFVFVYERISLLWLIIVLSVVALLDITLFVVLRNRRKQNKETKLASFSPLFLASIFISEIELAIIIVLSLVIIAFTAINVIYALLLTKNKEKELDSEVVEEDEKVEDANETLDEDDQISDNEKGFKKFTEKLEESSDEVKNYYDIIKNELLSYSKVKSKISYKHEMFRIGREIIARVKFRGKTLCLYLALNPSDYENSKYKVEDMSSYSSSASLPTMYRVNLPRRAKYALDLISDLMKKLNVEKNQNELANNL